MNWKKVVGLFALSALLIVTGCQKEDDVTPEDTKTTQTGGNGNSNGNTGGNGSGNTGGNGGGNTGGEVIGGYTVPSNLTTLHALINDVRSKGCTCGNTKMPVVPALTFTNKKLEQAARNHSQDMSDNNFTAHAGSDGSSPGDRLDRVGYNWSTWAENVASGFTSERAVFMGWLNSPGHCKNIMHANMREAAWAEVNNYWTLVFGKSR